MLGIIQLQRQENLNDINLYNMQSIQQTLKNAAVGGTINIEKAMAALARFDVERASTVELLTKAEKQVGMYLGEEINEHVAKMTGGHFSATEYHYEAMPSDQRI